MCRSARLNDAAGVCLGGGCFSNPVAVKWWMAIRRVMPRVAEILPSWEGEVRLRYGRERKRERERERKIHQSCASARYKLASAFMKSPHPRPASRRSSSSTNPPDRPKPAHPYVSVIATTSSSASANVTAIIIAKPISFSHLQCPHGNRYHHCIHLVLR